MHGRRSSFLTAALQDFHGEALVMGFVSAVITPSQGALIIRATRFIGSS